MYIITASRITSGELLKYRNGFFIQEGYGLSWVGSSQFALTIPAEFMIRGRGCLKIQPRP